MFIQNELKILNFANYGISPIKESIIPNLTTQQKKITLLASLTFGLIAVSFFLLRQWANKLVAKAGADIAKAKDEAAKYKKEAIIAKDELAQYMEEAIKAQDELAQYQEEAIKSKGEIAKYRQEAQKAKDKAAATKIEAPPAKSNIEKAEKKPAKTAKSEDASDPKLVNKDTFKIITVEEWNKGAHLEEKFQEKFKQVQKIQRTLTDCSLRSENGLFFVSSTLLAVKSDQTIVGFLCGAKDPSKNGFIVTYLAATTTFASQRDGEIETSLMLQAMKNAKLLGINQLFGDFECSNPDGEKGKRIIDFCKSFNKFNAKVDMNWSLSPKFDLSNFKG